MASRRNKLAGWCLAVAAVVAIAPRLMAQSPAAAEARDEQTHELIRTTLREITAPDAPAPAEMTAPTQPAAPVEEIDPEVSRRLIERKAKRRGQKAEVKGPPPKLSARPERIVEAPTLDAAGVDALLDQHLAEAKVVLARPTGDEEFLRRLCLDVAGTLPSLETIRAFRRDHSRDKRARMIDDLLAGPAYPRNWARYWRDVVKFHATNENGNQVRFDAMESWLAEQIGRNAPWDEVASAMITATGPVGEVGATNLTAAHGAQPVELAGEVARIFLGIQIQCAQCHDHPNAPWKREQFHEFAAFFAGSKLRPIAMPENKDKDKDAAKKKMQGPRLFEVITQGTPRYTMPDLKDPQTQIPVEPKFFLATSSEPVPAKLPAAQRRTLVASCITGQDNPWFAKAYVNRVWGALMGEGFTNPVDDLGPSRTADAPDVLDALASQWQRGGYDVRWLFRTILNTKAYQREFRASNSAAGRTPFAANTPSRLRSDQILDALSEALDTSLDAPPAGSPGQDKGKGKEPGGFRNGPRKNFNDLFGVDPSTPAEDILGTIPQALFLMNGAKVHQAIEARPRTMLGQLLTAHPDNRSALQSLYFRVLARRPTAAEVKACDRHLVEVRGDRNIAFEDILWCLVNSTEFLSRR